MSSIPAGKEATTMNDVFGWRNYCFTDTHCGTENGQTLWYDENGLFNVCSAEVIHTAKEFERVTRRRFRSNLIQKDTITRCYLKIGYRGDDLSGKTKYEIVEIRPEEIERAEAVCEAVRKKVADYESKNQ
jgi:hypothetical protein